jgi:hypothetical protein
MQHMRVYGYLSMDGHAVVQLFQLAGEQTQFVREGGEMLKRGGKTEHANDDNKNKTEPPFPLFGIQ